MSPVRSPVCETRPGKPDDLAFVVDSWTKHAFRHARMRNATAHVRSLLARPGSYLSVAHVPGEPDAILGWAVVEEGSTVAVLNRDGTPGVLDGITHLKQPACVHYVYVRSAARKTGVARSLVGRLALETVEYSSAAPVNLALPQTWTVNTARAAT